LGELKNRCVALQAQCDQIRQTQQQMAQTMAELAEQNASLIGVVNRLQSRLRLLSVAVTVLAGVALALWWVRHGL
jgi:chromosome segregation ATPase